MAHCVRITTKDAEKLGKKYTSLSTAGFVFLARCVEWEVKTLSPILLSLGQYTGETSVEVTHLAKYCEKNNRQGPCTWQITGVILSCLSVSFTRQARFR